MQDVEQLQQRTVGQILWDAADGKAGIEQISEQQRWRVGGELPAEWRAAQRSRVWKKGLQWPRKNNGGDVPQDGVDLVSGNQREEVSRAIQREEATQSLAGDKETS